jgi:hypothetical protein
MRAVRGRHVRRVGGRVVLGVVAHVAGHAPVVKEFDRRRRGAEVEPFARSCHGTL